MAIAEYVCIYIREYIHVYMYSCIHLIATYSGTVADHTYRLHRNFVIFAIFVTVLGIAFAAVRSGITRRSTVDFYHPSHKSQRK